MNLRLSDVSVQVSDGPETLQILDGIDLSVDAGEVVAVTGESGSGKSTLVAVAGLLRPPTSGSVANNGTDMSGVSDKERTNLRRTEIGLVFQSANLFPSLTAMEQLELVAHVNGTLNSQARERAAEILERVGMTDRLHQRPGKLSGGERQRVALARALMNEPSIVLADEPTASVDAAKGREIMALLAESAQRSGAATVIVTHAPDQLQHCDRMLHLTGGKLVEATAERTGGQQAQPTNS